MSVANDTERNTQRRGAGRAGRDGDGGGEGSIDAMRTPPHDGLAEQAVLGSMMLSKDAIADVVDKIDGRDFYRPVHQNIYAAIIDLYGRGEPADAVTVAADLDRRGLLVRIGGANYLLDLIQCVPTAASGGYYAGIVAEKAILRRLVEAGTRVVQYGYAGAEGVDVSEVVDRAQAEVYDVAENRRTATEFRSFADLIQPSLDEIDALGSGVSQKGVMTGFRDLDELTNGFQPGQLIVVAARPGHGKSTLAIDFLRNCSLRNGHPAVMFSLEMSTSEIMMRIISAQAGVKLANVRAGQCNDDDWTRMARMMGECAEAPLFIDDSPNLTMMEIRAKARRLKQKHGLTMIVVDYLQLMTGGKNYQSREQEISDYSRSLKLLAKELEVPIVALSQLNRKAEDRHDKKPMLSDLRESGSIEQDADMVILIHRPDAYNPDDARAGEADLLLAKNRSGPTRSLAVCHQLHMSRFADMARGF